MSSTHATLPEDMDDVISECRQEHRNLVQDLAVQISSTTDGTRNSIRSCLEGHKDPALEHEVALAIGALNRKARHQRHSAKKTSPIPELRMSTSIMRRS